MTGLMAEKRAWPQASKTAQSNYPHLFRESSEEISSSEEVQDQVQLSFSLECCKFIEVQFKLDSTGNKSWNSLEFKVRNCLWVWEVKRN